MGEEKKSNYQRELKDRVREYFTTSTHPGQVIIPDELIDEIYGLVKAECLVSFKNGKEMAGKPPYRGKPRSARLGTSAPKDPKLKPGNEA